MGSYGIGPARIAAAAVEQFADERGIAWPRALAPWDVELVALGKPGTPEREAAERLYASCRRRLLRCCSTIATSGPARSSPTPSCSACPLRLTVGQALARVGQRRGAGRAAGQRRPRGRRPARRAPQRRCAELWRERSPEPPGSAPADLPASVGLDRSGPPPPETLAGPPLQAVDDPQRDRLRPPRADPVVPRRRRSRQRRAAPTRCPRSSSRSSAGATTPTASPRA